MFGRVSNIGEISSTVLFVEVGQVVALIVEYLVDSSDYASIVPEPSLAALICPWAVWMARAYAHRVLKAWFFVDAGPVFAGFYWVVDKETGSDCEIDQLSRARHRVATFRKYGRK